MSRRSERRHRRASAAIVREAPTRFLRVAIPGDETAKAAASARLTAASTPLVVLTAGKEEWPPGASPENAAKMSQIWMENQVELTRWSSNSVQVVATNSSHFMEGDVPELVIAAVRAAVEAARTHRPLDAPSLRGLAGK